MQKNKSVVVARRAWHFLRLALLWARKGGGFSRNSRLMLMLAHLRLFPKHLIKKAIRNSNHQRGPGALAYGDRELSFDETPVIHLKMHRPSSLRFKMPNIPCINPQVMDFHYDFGPDDDDDYYNHDDQDLVSSKSFLKAAAAADHDENEDHDNHYGFQEINSPSPTSDEGIDLKAERFIAKFYHQIKLQRQISYLQYNEMITRGAS